MHKLWHSGLITKVPLDFNLSTIVAIDQAHSTNTASNTLLTIVISSRLFSPLLALLLTLLGNSPSVVERLGLFPLLLLLALPFLSPFIQF